VILVALVVLVVPELLSGPGSRATSPQGAAEEPPLRSVRLDLGDDLHGLPASRPEPEGSAPTKAPAATAPEESSASTSAASQASASAAGHGLAVSAPAPGNGLSAPPALSASAPRAHPVTSAHPATSRAAHPQRPARAQPLDARAWTVQVGSFESRERADRLVHRLKVAGFAAFVSESASHGRRWYRVRVGPERDRTAARAVAVRLHAAGHTGAVVPP